MQRGKALKGKRLLLKMDSQNGISWVDRGRLGTSIYNRWCVGLMALEVKYGIRIRTVFVKSKQNAVADALTREYVREDYITHPDDGRRFRIGTLREEVVGMLASFLSDPLQTILERHGFFRFFSASKVSFSLL